MQYIFTSYFANGLKDVTTRADDIPASLFEHLGDVLEVTQNNSSAGALRFVDRDSFESWWDDMARAGTWLGVRKTTEKVDIEGVISTMKAQPIEPLPLQHEVKDHINPSHYKTYLSDEGMELQWLETMCRMQRYREHPERFLGALELQIRKYLDRSGKKDEELQEYKKALWYMKFMCAYMANNCKPIKVADIPSLLGD